MESGRGRVFGAYPSQIDESFAERLGSVCANSFKGDIIIAKDERKSSCCLKDAFVKGLTECGKNAIDIGSAAPDMMPVACRHYRKKISVIFSGLDMPWNFSGVSLLSDKGRSIDIPAGSGIADRKGAVYEDSENFFREYCQEAVSFLFRYFKRIDAKIVVDCSCGPSSHVLPHLLEYFGAKVVKVNCNPGENPLIDPNPYKRGIAYIKNTMKAVGADICVGTDAGGGKAFCIKNGKMLSGDEIFRILAQATTPDKICASEDSQSEIHGIKIARDGMGFNAVCNNSLSKSAGLLGCPDGSFAFPGFSAQCSGTISALLLAAYLRNIKSPTDERNGRNFVRKSVSGNPETLMESVKSIAEKDFGIISESSGIRFGNDESEIFAYRTSEGLSFTAEGNHEDKIEQNLDFVINGIKGVRRKIRR